MPNSLGPHGLQPIRLLCPWDFPDKDTGVGRHFLFQGISRPRDWTQVSCTAGRFFTDWATREAYLICFSSNEFRRYQLMFISNVTLQEKCEVNWTLTRVVSKLRHFRWNLWYKQNYCISNGWDVKSAPFLDPTDTWRMGSGRQRAPFPTASLSCWC